MIYRGPGLFALQIFGSSHTPSPSSWLAFSVFLCAVGRAFGREWGGESGGGAKSYDGEKAYSFINHSILSGPMPKYWKQAALTIYSTSLNLTLDRKQKCLLKNRTFVPGKKILRNFFCK
jgi:hypothetical protein